MNIATTFHNRSEKNVKLYIRASSAQRFCDLIRPFVIPEMLYKLTKPLPAGIRSTDNVRVDEIV